MPHCHLPRLSTSFPVAEEQLAGVVVVLGHGAPIHLRLVLPMMWCLGKTRPSMFATQSQKVCRGGPRADL